MKHDIRLKLPANWQSIPRGQRLRYFGELHNRFGEGYPNDWDEWPVEQRRSAELWLALVVGLDTGTLTAAKVRELRTIMRGEPCSS